VTGSHSPLEQPTPPRPAVSVKGREDGLHVTVTDAAAADIEAELRRQLRRRTATFFAGAPVVLQMPAGRLDLALAARLATVIEAAGMEVTAVLPTQPGRGSRQRDRATPAAAPAASASAGGEAVVVSGTVRSGQRVAHPGSIVILGDVNPGGVVSSGGSVIVWGRLRGFVEAGQAEGAPDAVVCALDLAPTQLRIGDALARAPEDAERTPEPEVAREANGTIVVEAWR